MRFYNFYSIPIGGTLGLGNMDINSISCLTLINQSILVSNDKPTLLDIDDLSDEEDSQGIQCNIVCSKMFSQSIFSEKQDLKHMSKIMA